MYFFGIYECMYVYVCMYLRMHVCTIHIFMHTSMYVMNVFVSIYLGI